MRILWLINVMPPYAAQALGLNPGFGGSWIASLLAAITKLDTDISLFVAAPAAVEEIQSTEVDGVTFFAFPPTMQGAEWQNIVELSNPAVVHLHGTEYKHGFHLMQAYPDLPYVTSLQGVITFYAPHFTAFLPPAVARKRSLRDLIKNDSIRKNQQEFYEQGTIEEYILRHSSGVIGRTAWDRACAHWLAPAVPYFHCNECLRPVFYNQNWSFENCEPFSIFVPQANYPIKGFHLLLDALPYLVRDYPNLRVYVAGNANLFPAEKSARLKQRYYQHYLEDKIEANGLKDHITFTGILNEQEMCERLVKSHVFVMPSVIENSPNALGEAMLTGVPTVAANVGGVSTMMSDGEEGLLYPADEPYMLAYYVHCVFADTATAALRAERAAKKARSVHDYATNAARTIEIYQRIAGLQIDN
ncbi:MAG TPA: glycosyltransferase family 4 protein [Clostridiaceae bacterium]|nr:glycosyltransferase family 4 protein [Clostridiaceae bacterium]